MPRVRMKDQERRRRAQARSDRDFELRLRRAHPCAGRDPFPKTGPPQTRMCGENGGAAFLTLPAKPRNFSP